MCGIVGYIGTKQAFPILIKGLHRLEYRGYDSAGVALINTDRRLNVYKAKGKVADLEQVASDKDISGTIGIGHTRWATHGEPSDVNAHPHISQDEKIALIHNGIIENYETLRSQLEAAGYTFKSETDTEVLVQFINYLMELNHTDLCSAVQMALNQVTGAYAIAVIEKGNPDTIIAARKSSPLVVGIGEGEFFLASDASPFVEYTQKVVYLNDEEIAILSRGEELKIKTLNNIEKTPQIKLLEMNLSQLEKGKYPYYMEKEIFEQTKTLKTCLSGRINLDCDNIAISGFFDNKERFLNAERIVITACGTSWHAGLIGMYAIEEFARIPVTVEYSSEFRYRNPVITKNDVVIAISQSGETADTLAAMEIAKNAGAFVFGICNVVGSSIARLSDAGCYTHVGPEVGVASTKAFTAQVLVLQMLALTIAKERNCISKDRFTALLSEMNKLPKKIQTILKLNDKLEAFSRIFTYASNFIYLGRGYNYPIALEGALKLKEISYIHAEGYPAAEMKHGPIALISEEMPVVVIATSSSTYEKVVSNIQEIKARKGKVIAIVTEGDDVVSKLADYCIQIPNTEECLSPVLTVVPLQLLAYHIAVAKGKDVDQPRNLAKSVTVE
ncbi:MAG: glutamine--fructose-6-phosphate transaminase (isomerizing) [Paludibacteraceae bacterium]|nr:glutamine--fructose-6-phosphate transaminase (isomerizing) [Paludibacteraceae bacterium]